MTHHLLPAALLAALTLAACASKPAQPVSDPATADSLAIDDEARLYWLQDNDGDKLNPASLFDAPAALIDSLGLAEGIPASMSYLLLQTEDHNILFDAGLGPKMGGHILERLSDNGLTPDDIDLIFLTHLHPDHIGGLMGAEGPLFTHAEVYVGAVEYDAWMNQMTPEQAGLQQGIMGAYAEQIRQFAFGDTLPCGVLAVDAVGHTPGHTAFLWGRNLIIGDLMHGLALQIDHPEVCANFDMDKPQSIASRKRLLEYAHTNGLTLVGMHLPAPGSFSSVQPE